MISGSPLCWLQQKCPTACFRFYVAGNKWELQLAMKQNTHANIQRLQFDWWTYCLYFFAVITEPFCGCGDTLLVQQTCLLLNCGGTQQWLCMCFLSTWLLSTVEFQLIQREINPLLWDWISLPYHNKWLHELCVSPQNVFVFMFFFSLILQQTHTKIVWIYTRTVFTILILASMDWGFPTPPHGCCHCCVTSDRYSFMKSCKCA